MKLDKFIINQTKINARTPDRLDQAVLGVTILGYIRLWHARLDYTKLYRLE